MANKGKKMDISDMNIVQLSNIKQQLDQEIELLANSIQQLQSAKNKYQESGECVERQKTVKEETEILVPLTGSMYVPGKIAATNRFILDIGTGYFAEKDLNASVEFFERKVKFLTEQMETYMKIAQEKVNLRENIIEALQFKQQQAAATQQTAASSAVTKA